MVAKKNKAGLSALIQAGQAKSQELSGKNTQSETPIEKSLTDKKESDNERNAEQMKNQLSSSAQDKKGNKPSKGQEVGVDSFVNYLKKREDKESTELVRFPTSYHNKLKMLAVVSGVPMYMIIANIIGESLEKHDKEITKILRDSL